MLNDTGNESEVVFKTLSTNGSTKNNKDTHKHINMKHLTWILSLIYKYVKIYVSH